MPRETSILLLWCCAHCTSSAQQDTWKGDLPGIEARGVLRILAPADAEADAPPKLAQRFAERWDLRCELVSVSASQDLIPALVAGLGDLVTDYAGVLDKSATAVRASRPTPADRLNHWLMRAEDRALGAAVDAFLIEEALSPAVRQSFRGDLAAIQTRGVLRIITRNNPVSYFLYRGEPHGFDYALSRLLADELHVRLEVVVPPSRELLLPWLLQGKGDVIAAGLTITKERQELVQFSLPYLWVRELLVHRVGSPPMSGLDDLRGRTITVRASSSYYQTLQEIEPIYGPFVIALAPEHYETQELLAQVGDGDIEYTVSDSHILDVERAHRGDVEAALVLTPDAPEQIAFAMRPENRVLTVAVDAFVSGTVRGTTYNVLRHKYFDDPHAVRWLHRGREQEQARISPYDDLVRKAAQEYALDWRLLAAQMYQESRFDPQARSWMGAMGLFQLMPSTASELGLRDPLNPEGSIRAGARHLSLLVGQLDRGLELQERLRLALAAFNAGKGHVDDARQLAVEQGWDPTKWFGHVERAMLLLARARYYENTRFGYCRGSETVRYVAEIQERYDKYVRAFPR